MSKRLPLLLSSVLVAFPNCSMESPIALPLPSRLAAPVFSRSDSAPWELAPFGPSASASWVTLAYSWSTSTGVALRSAASVARSFSLRAARVRR